MNRELVYLHILWLLIVSPLAPNALATSNIDPNHKYAWSAASGWINFHPIYDGVMVYPDHLAGEAWTEQSGWVQLGNYSGGGSHRYENTSSTNWGVNHDGAGQLSGYAWSDMLGWINFNPTNNPVIIDQQSGDFQGHAWSELGGWIQFQQDETPSYKVRSLKEKPTLLTLTISVSGSGSIKSTPNEVVCSEAGSDCQFQYEEGATVTLIPTAVVDYQFSHWEGNSDCDDGQLVMTTDILCIAHFQPVVSPPILPSCTITTVYKGNGETLDCEKVIITKSGTVSRVMFMGLVENEGIISNSVVATTASIIGGTLTGTINNEGTIADVIFVGTKLSGGKLAGTIKNESQVDGVIADVELLPKTTLSGSFLGSQIRADSTSLIQDVRLKADFKKLTGGQLDGIVQGNPTEIAQIIDADQILSTAQLSYVCLSPTVQLPSNLDNVIGEGVAYQISHQCKELNEILSDDPPVEVIPRLPPSFFSKLTTNQLNELPATILDEFSPQHIAAINPEEFKKLPNHMIGKILVHLNANHISRADVEPLLPTGWNIKPNGALQAPVGTQLILRDLPPPKNLPNNVTLPPQPDFQTSFALGGKSNTSTIADFNQVLEVTVSQNDQGVLETIDSNRNRYAFRNDNDNMLQIKDTVTGLARDEGGFFLINASENQQYRLLPTPIDIIELANLLAEGEVVLHESGELLMELSDQSVVVALFDPLVEEVTGSIKPRFELPSPNQVRKREAELGWVYYSDGTRQAFQPTVLSPQTFIDHGLQFDNQVESVHLIADGGFYVNYAHHLYIIKPQFGIQMEPHPQGSAVVLSGEEQEPMIIYPAIIENEGNEAAMLQYALTIVEPDNPANTRRRSGGARQTRFTFTAEVIPYECQEIETGIMNQHFYCDMNEALLNQCQQEDYYGALSVEEWQQGIERWRDYLHTACP